MLSVGGLAFFMLLQGTLQYAPMETLPAGRYTGKALTGGGYGSALDYAIVVVYFLLILAIGTYYGRDQRSTKDFFFGGQRFAWWIIAFSLIAVPVALTAGGRPRRVDAVLSMSPPLTLGAVGAIVARARSGRAVFNIQDVFPDAAVRTGAITNRRIIAIAERLERLTYRLSDAVTVLSGDLLNNLTAKVPADRRGDIEVIANFVDTGLITPGPRDNDYRREFGLTGTVAMYAGNVGFSQSLDIVIEAARQLPEITFVINGDGAAREQIGRAHV